MEEITPEDLVAKHPTGIRRSAENYRTKESLIRGWGPTTNQPYYKKRYAELVRAIVDKLASVYPNAIKIPRSELNGATITSTYLKYTQGLMYLIDHMDTGEGLYRGLRARFVIRRKYDYLLFEWKYTRDRAMNETSMKVPGLTVVEPNDKSNKQEVNWTRMVQDFIEDDTAVKLGPLESTFTEDDILNVQTWCAGTDVYVDMTKSKLILLRGYKPFKAEGV